MGFRFPNIFPLSWGRQINIDIGRTIQVSVEYLEIYPDFHDGLPGLVNIQKAIEHGPVEIVDLPMKNGDLAHSYVTVYQRVNGFQ